MSCRILKGHLKRKLGTQWWVVRCPYCDKNHGLAAGKYTEDPAKYLGVRKLPCGSTIELHADEPSRRRLKKLKNK